MRRLLKILGFALAGLVLLLAGAWLLRGPLLARPLGRLVADGLGDALGGRFECERVEGDFFSGVVLVGLRTLEAPPEGAVTGLGAERAEVRYRLFDLLGSDPLSAIDSVTVSGAEVALDLTRPAPAEEEPAPLDLEGVLLALPQRLPAVDVRGDVAVATADGPVALDGLEVASAGARTLRLRAKRLLLPATFAPENAGPLDVSITLDAAQAVEVTAREPIAGVLLEELRVGTRLDYRARLAAGGRTRIEAEGDLASARLRLAPLDLADLPRWVLAAVPGDARLPAEGQLEAEARVEWKDAVRASGELTARDLRFREYVAHEVHLKGDYDDGRGTIATIEARLEGGTVDGRGIELDVNRPLVVTSIEHFEAEVPDLKRFVPGLDRDIALRVKAGSPDARTFALEEVRVESEGSTATLRGSAIRPDDPEDWQSTEVTLDLDARVGDLSRIDPDLPAIDGVLTVSGGIRGQAGHPKATLGIRGTDLLVEQRAVRRVEIYASLDGFVAEVGRALVDAAPGSVEAGGTVDLEAGTVTGGRFAFDVPDLAGFVAMLPGLPKLAGSVKGNGSGAWDGERATGKAHVEGTNVVLDGEALGGFELDANADGEDFEVARLVVDHPEGRVSLSGSAHPVRREARIRTLSVEARGERAEAAAPFDVAWTEDGGVEAKGLDLRVLGGTVRGDAGWTGSAPRASLNWTDLDVARVLPETGGLLSGSADVDGGTAALTVDVPDFRWQGRQGHVAVRVHQDASGGLVVERVEVDAQDLARVEASGRVPWRVDPETGLVRVEGTAPESGIHLSAVVPDLARVLDIEKGSLDLTLDARGSEVTGTLRLDDLVAAGRVALPGTTTMSLRGDPGGVRATVESSPDGAAILRGSVTSDHGVDWTRSVDLERVIDAARVDGQVSLEIPDLGVFESLLPDIPHIAGSGRIDAQVSGALRAPKAEGSIVLSGFEVAPGGELPPIRDGEAKITFDGRSIHVAELTGSLGYEPFHLTGSVDLARGDPEFDLHLEGKNLLLARSRDLRARADVSLAVTGPLSALEVGGRVEVVDALYSVPTPLVGGGGARTADAKLQLFSIRSGPLSTMRFDVEVRGSDSVRVSNNIVRGSFSPALHLGGTGAVPEPVGSIFFRDTLVRLPFSSLKVDQGEIRFARENPFSPRIEVLAHTRMRGYDLTVHTSGQLPDVEVVVSSVPSLAQEDAFVLLSTGSLPADFEGEAGAKTALSKVGTYVGKSLIDRLSGPSDPDKETVFDRLEVVIGRDISREGNETVEAEFRMLPRWYLRIEMDRYDEYNGGVVWRLRFR